MVGHKLGEFAPTRQFAGHTPADKKAAAEKATAVATTTPGGDKKQLWEKRKKIIKQIVNQLGQ